MGGDGWGGGKIYGTFKLFTPRGSCVEDGAILFQLPFETEKSEVSLTEWKETLVHLYEMNTIQIFKLIYHLSFGTRKDFFKCIFLCLCWGVKVKLEQCSSLLVAASEELLMWLERNGACSPSLLLNTKHPHNQTQTLTHTTTSGPLLLLQCLLCTNNINKPIVLFF